MAQKKVPAWELQATLNRFEYYQNQERNISLKANIGLNTKNNFNSNILTAKKVLTMVNSSSPQVMGTSISSINSIWLQFKTMIDSILLQFKTIVGVTTPSKIETPPATDSETPDIISGKILKPTPGLTETLDKLTNQTTLPPTKHLIVKYKTKVKQLNDSKIIKILNQNEQVKSQIIEVNASDTTEVLSKLANDPDVAYAEEDTIYSIYTEPNDTYFSNQWALNKIQIIPAWNTTHTSANIKVAVEDTGIDTSRLDLADRVVKRANFTTDTDTDDYGHGTAVASIISAIVNNKTGISGASYDAHLISVKVLDKNGQGYVSWLADGIRWASDNEADIINISLGGNSPSQYLLEAVNYANSKGVVLVAAAGNDGSSTPVYPAYYSSVISVGATDKNDQKATFSNYGSWVTMSAPGVSIISDYKGTYSYLSGTSMAAPHVSALAAMVRTQHPEWTSGQVILKLEQSTDNTPYTGIYWKYGRINACKAVDCTLSSTTPTIISTATPTTIPTSAQKSTSSIGCNNLQTVSLSHQEVLTAFPGDTINNNLITVNNDSSTCSSLFTISSSVPTGWTLNGIPTGFNLAGGKTKDIPFTITVPNSAVSGKYSYQFWVAKTGQTNVSPVNGQVQVTSLTPTSIPTPTPTPNSCISPWSVSLGSTDLSGEAGQVLNESLTITNNNPQTCTGGTFTISSGVPSGYTLLNLPPSIFLAGGQSQTINFTITISTGDQVGDHTAEFWVNGGQPLNVTIHVTATAPPPEQSMFSNLSAKTYGDYALFKFSYNAYGTGNFRMDIASDPSALNQTMGPNVNGFYGYAYTSGTPMDPSNQATPTSIRSFIKRTPQSWSKYTCGSTIYWRMYNSGDLRIMSPVQTGTVDCTTVVDILPWTPWYSAIYQGIYDVRYDADSNGKIDWYDYWILVDQTRLR